MDLNHIRLSPKLITELYQTALVGNNEKVTDFVVTEPVIEQITPDSDKTVKSWKTLGNNQKNILVVVDYPTAVFLPDHELTLLTGIISACKLTIADIAIINLHHYKKASFRELIVFFQSKTVFLFGIEPTTFGLPLSFPHFQIQPFSNVTYLFSPSLKELENDKVLKIKLWVSLKKIFGL